MKALKRTSVFLVCFVMLLPLFMASKPILTVKSAPKRIKLLPILLDFKDDPHQRTIEEIADMFFGTKPDTKTLPNYFMELGSSDLEFVPGSYGVGEWLRLPKSKLEYAKIGSVIPIANDAMKLIEKKRINLDEYDDNDDGTLDFVIFVQAGDPMAEGYDIPFWPHAYTLGEYVGIGTKRISKYNMTAEVFNYDRTAPIQAICHEFYHYLGGWDLYSYLYTGHYAVGSWDIMAEDFNNFGMNGFSRAYMGWMTPTIITKSGVYEINAIASSESNRLYQVNIPGTQEYFLIENRQFVGVDAWWGGIPSTGLTFTHVDGKIKPEHRFNDGPTGANDPKHFAVWVEDGGGVKEKKDAVYCADKNRTKFTPDTNPNTLDYENKSNVGIFFTEISKSGLTMTFRVDFKFSDPFPSTDLDEVDFGKIQKGIQKTKSIRIINVGKGTLNATISSKDQWISFTPEEITGNDVIVQLIANADYTKIGKYKGRIDIKCKIGTYSLPTKIEIVEKLGDINGDGSIDEADFKLLLACFGSKKGDMKFNPACDFDLNEKIDAFDLAILSKNIK
jgi:M6 family metalloprotease-like protein